MPVFAANGSMAHPMAMVSFPHLARFTEDVSEEALPQYITRLNSVLLPAVILYKALLTVIGDLGEGAQEAEAYPWSCSG